MDQPLQSRTWSFPINLKLFTLAIVSLRTKKKKKNQNDQGATMGNANKKPFRGDNQSLPRNGLNNAVHYVQLILILAHL